MDALLTLICFLILICIVQNIIIGVFLVIIFCTIKGIIRFKTENKSQEAQEKEANPLGFGR